jgi:hypothetical protein
MKEKREEIAAASLSCSLSLVSRRRKRAAKELVLAFLNYETAAAAARR